MKRTILGVILILVILAAFTIPAAAADYVLLTDKTTTGAGSTVGIGEYIEKWTCQITITGGPSAVTVRIEGNLGGLLYDPTGMAEHTFSAGQLAAGIANFTMPDRYTGNMRGNVITLTGGTTPAVSVTCGGVPR